MSPAIAEQSFRGIDAETRAKLDSLPSNDEVLADAIKHSRVVVGQAGAATPVPTAAGRGGAANRLRRSRTQSGAVSGDFSRSTAQRAADRGGGGRPRSVLDQSRARRHRPPRAGDHGSARRAGALAHHGNAAGRHPVGRHPGRASTMPACSRWRCRVSKCRPTRTANSGSISTNTIRRAYVSAKDVLQGSVLAGPLSRQARAHRHLGDRPARPQDDAGRGGDARASKCTLRSSKAS